MKLSKRILVAFVLLLATLPAWAQSIGRVLVASGEVNIVRGNATQPATAGATLQVGDRVRTGTAGTAQIWFTDSSVVALRNGSDFLIEQYSYNNGAATDALVFNLVRGGYRTVAGLIGIQDRKAYVVKTKMATLGRRGTQYGILYCEQDCPLPAGGLAPDGLYGGVYDGRVGVANSTPEVQFGRDEYFYVASINSIPQPLLGPPSFFADRLAGLAKNAQKPASEPPASKDGQDVSPAEASADVVANAAPYTATENRNASGRPQLTNSTFTGPAALSTAHSLLGTDGRPEAYGGTAIVPGNAVTVLGIGAGRSLSGFDFVPEGQRYAGSLGTGTITMQGYDAASDTSWGRWVGGSVSTADPSAQSGNQNPGTGLHYLIAAPFDSALLAAKTGSFTFSDLGGTTPTASNGETASSFSIGPLNIDFVTRVGVLTSLNVNFATSQWSFSNFTFNFLQPNAVGAHIDGDQSNVGSCTGSGCGPIQGSNTARFALSGNFIGNGNYAGLSMQGVSGAGQNQSRITFGVVRLFGNPQPLVSPPVTLLLANSLVEINGSVASYGGALTGTAANLTLNGTGPSQTLTAFNFPQFTFSGAAGGGGISGAGFDSDSGVYYGRWISGTITSGAQQAPQLPAGTQTSGMGVHYLYGTPTPDAVIAAKTGSAQYVDFVGTFPSASNGESSNSYNFGPININFTNRTGVITSAQFSFPTSSWNFSNLAFNINVTPGQGASFDANLINVGSCSGSGCGPIQGSNTARADFFGRFIGSSGNFLGLSFQGNSGGNTPSGNPNLTIGVARVFKCPTCP